MKTLNYNGRAMTTKELEALSADLMRQSHTAYSPVRRADCLREAQAIDSLLYRTR
jgi:hypothetical protein